MSLIPALAAVLALSAPQSVLADLKPADRADLQCMAVALVTIGGSEDEAMKAALVSGATFYYGRMQGRTPSVDWLQRLVNYIKTEPMEELEANRMRCAGEMQAMGDAFSGIGSKMAAS